MRSIHKSLIREQIGKGKSYIGLCAGAICAVKEFQQLSTTRPNDMSDALELVDVSAKGLCCFSDQYPGSAQENPFETARGVVVQHDGRDVPVYWNLGPAFETQGEEVVATYSLPNGKTLAAVVSSRFGSGSVVLSGVHPEIITDKGAHVKIQGVVKECPTLSDDVEGQRNLFRDICRRAGILPLSHRELV